MGELAAGFAGSMVLSILGIGAKFLRADRQIVPPTAKEQQDMAIAIREVANRRVNVLGAVDDLLMLGGATWNYSTRALVAELEPQREAPEVIVTPAPVKSAEGGGVA
jgi:hypothetical protein